MSRVLIDSSAWISYFRGKQSAVTEEINTLLDNDDAVLCGMVELEILQGLRPNEQSKIRDLFQALHFVDTLREDFVSAGLMLNQLRSKGITIPSSDCLIAAVCIRCNISLYTLDNDFNHLSKLKRFKVISL